LGLAYCGSVVASVINKGGDKMFTYVESVLIDKVNKLEREMVRAKQRIAELKKDVSKLKKEVVV